MGKKKYYAVRRGRHPGIYRQWFGPEGAQVQVAGFPGAEYKGFGSLEEAEYFMRPHENEADQGRTHDDGVILVFTDGGALGNPGPGGFGVVILEPDCPPRELCGGFELTTNNRMELMGGIAALEALTGNQAIILHSDSRYLVDAVNKGWARSWRRKGWRKSNGTPALNIDLWARLLDLLEERNVHFKWVKGHAGNVWNERCDQLVHAAIAGGGLAVDEGYGQSPV